MNEAMRVVASSRTVAKNKADDGATAGNPSKRLRVEASTVRPKKSLIRLLGVGDEFGMDRC